MTVPFAGGALTHAGRSRRGCTGSCAWRRARCGPRCCHSTLALAWRSRRLVAALVAGRGEGAALGRRAAAARAWSGPSTRIAPSLRPPPRPACRSNCCFQRSSLRPSTHGGCARTVVARPRRLPAQRAVAVPAPRSSGGLARTTCPTVIAASAAGKRITLHAGLAGSRRLRRQRWAHEFAQSLLESRLRRGALRRRRGRCCQARTAGRQAPGATALTPACSGAAGEPAAVPRRADSRGRA